MNRTVPAVAIAILLLLAGIARAEPLEPRARDYLAAGIERFEAEDYENAAAQFRLGLAIQEHPDLLYALAQSERMLGDCARALEHYRATLDKVEAESERAEAVRIQIERCEKEVEREREENERERADATPTLKASPGAVIGPPEDDRPSPRSRMAGWLLLGAGAIAAGVGTYLYVDGKGATDDADRDYQHLVDARDSYPRARIGLATAAGGAALAAAGAFLVLRGRF